MIDESAYKAGVQRVMAERDAALERAEKAEGRYEKRTRQWSTVSRQASDLEERCRGLRERAEKAERERDEARARLAKLEAFRQAALEHGPTHAHDKWCDRIPCTCSRAGILAALDALDEETDNE